MIRYITELIESGDYIPDENGSLSVADYTAAILQDLARAVSVSRGSFYPDKRFGGFSASGVQAVPAELYAAARARQALYNLGGIYVESVQQSNSGIILNLIINKEKRQVEITL